MLQSNVLKYSKETLGPLCLRVHLCHPFEKTSADSQPAVGRNYCYHKINAVGHTQAQVQVDDGERFFANAFILLFIKLFFCCVSLFGKQRRTWHCRPLLETVSISRLSTQSPFFAFVMKCLQRDTPFIIRVHPTVNSHHWLDSMSLNTTSAAPSGN